MTKEELEKEIRKYLKKTFHHEYYDDVVMVMGFAEPREKRIQELEEKLEQTEKDLADYQFNYPTIKELEKDKAYTEGQLDEQIQATLKLQKENAEWKQRNETLKDALEHARKLYGDDLEKAYKENAELKIKLEALEGQTPWRDIKDKSEMIRKLTEAKEIMQQLIANAPNTYSGTDIELQQKKMFSFQDAVNKAEQFLKE